MSKRWILAIVLAILLGALWDHEDAWDDAKAERAQAAEMKAALSGKQVPSAAQGPGGGSVGRP
jgi:hypothetical protein